MPRIMLDIPETYTRELEFAAKMRQKTFQEVVLDAIRMFIHTEENKADKYDVTKDPIYSLGTEDLNEDEPTENFSENIDKYLYGEGYPK